MDAKKLKDIRLRLTDDCAHLVKALNRNRTATAEVKVENTEDESDLATISHERELLYNLNESDFSRLRLIQQAIKAIDNGQYGDCIRCGEEINEKRLAAVPWATMCIGCQTQAEAESADSRMVLAGDDEVPEM